MQLLPDVSPLVNILQRAGKEKRNEISRQEAVNHAMFMDIEDNDKFFGLLNNQLNNGLIDADEVADYEQLAAMPFDQRNKTIARDLISTGFKDLVFDRNITGDGAINSGLSKTYSPSIVYRGEDAYVAMPTVAADGTLSMQYEPFDGDPTAFYGDKARSAEAGKGEAKMGYAGELVKLTKMAELDTKAIFDDKEMLNNLESNMSGLETVVSEMRELAGDATYTDVGKLTDYVANNIFGIETEGATAKAKWVSLVDNQILSQLKATFGAAFTVKEMEALRATMGSSDGTPSQRLAQLDSFINAKYRQVQSLKKKLGSKYRSNNVKSIDVGGTPNNQEKQPVKPKNVMSQKDFDGLKAGDSYIYEGKSYIKGNKK